MSGGGVGHGLLTVREVADDLRISPTTVRRYIASGRIAALRVGRSVRIRRTAVERFIEPIAPSTDESPIGRPLSFDDPIWGLVGIIDDGPTDLAANHDKYLAEAYGDLHLDDETDDDSAEAGVLTLDDSLWNIVGIGASAEPTDIRRHKEEGS